MNERNNENPFRPANLILRQSAPPKLASFSPNAQTSKKTCKHIGLAPCSSRVGVEPFSKKLQRPSFKNRRFYVGCRADSGSVFAKKEKCLTNCAVFSWPIIRCFPCTWTCVGSWLSQMCCTCNVLLNPISLNTYLIIRVTLIGSWCIQNIRFISDLSHFLLFCFWTQFDVEQFAKCFCSSKPW